MADRLVFPGNLSLVLVLHFFPTRTCLINRREMGGGICPASGITSGLPVDQEMARTDSSPLSDDILELTQEYDQSSRADRLVANLIAATITSSTKSAITKGCASKN